MDTEFDFTIARDNECIYNINLNINNIIIIIIQTWICYTLLIKIIS